MTDYKFPDGWKLYKHYDEEGTWKLLAHGAELANGAKYPRYKDEKDNIIATDPIAIELIKHHIKAWKERDVYVHNKNVYQFNQWAKGQAAKMASDANSAVLSTKG